MANEESKHLGPSQELTDNQRRAKSKYYSHNYLHVDLNSEDLISSHNANVQYWNKYMDNNSLNHEYRKGNTYTAEEERILGNKKKSLVRFNKIITSVRTIVGNFVNNKYDVKYAPFEPQDQDVSDIKKQVYAWHQHHTETPIKDMYLLNETITGGWAWQESYMEVVPGKKPLLVVKNQNTFAIYPDPNSMDLIEMSDCQFIDRVGWFDINTLMNQFPDWAGQIYGDLNGYEDSQLGMYTQTNRSADRGHEVQNERNGRFKVIERFYKLYKKHYYSIDDAGDRVDFENDDQAQKFIDKNPGSDLYHEKDEQLWYCVSCPSFQAGQFLYNGPYHNQPRDPVSKKIMFTLVRLIYENDGAEINGLVEYLRDPNKLVNSMVGNILHAAKHAANTSILVDPIKFDEEQLFDLQKHHADGDRTFMTKPGAGVNNAVGLMPQGGAAPDNSKVLEFADAMTNEFVPPSSKGMSEGSGVSGTLNKQWVQQAFIQLLGPIKNYMHFLKQRAKLWQYYDMEYMTDYEVIRVINKDKPLDPDFLELNKPYVDNYGAIRKFNDITVAEYDIIMEESYQSPQVRDKIREDIGRILQGPAAAQDPVLATALTAYDLKLSDAPQEMKDFVMEWSQVLKQAKAAADQAAQQTQDINNMGTELSQVEQLQTIADREAAATPARPNLQLEGATGNPQSRNYSSTKQLAGV